MKFDPTKPCTTRDGRAARVIATNRKNKIYPIVALVANDDNEEVILSFTLDGSEYLGSVHNNDLINIPEKRKVWVVLTDLNTHSRDTKEDLDKFCSVLQAATVPILAIKEVEFTVGEGL